MPGGQDRERETELSQLSSYTAELGTENKHGSTQRFQTSSSFWVDTCPCRYTRRPNRAPQAPPRVREETGSLREVSSLARSEGLTGTLGQPEVTTSKEARY